MSILDDAIREHLELKRAHGADEAEVKKLEDEAFGPPQRPGEVDAFAEAPTEFLTAPGAEEQTGEGAEAEGRRIPNIADLQEAPPAPRPPEPGEGAATEEPRAPEPSIEEQPAAEHKVVPAPESEPSPEPEQAAPAPEAQDELDKPDGVHTTEEREAIADQPTQMFDVQAEIDAGAEPQAEEPTDFDDDDFFSEQRLSDELNAALEAPVTDEEPLPPSPAPPSQEQVPLAPVEDPAGDEKGEGDSDEHSAYEPDTESHDDVLEDTPEFLEDTPEDDDLWFEQRPPKDFDFDD
jgi:hypothetical protein